MSELLFEWPVSGVAVVTLNRPAALNALSMALENALRDAIEAAEVDDEVHAIVLTGTGRAFCAGIDLKEAGAIGFGARQRPASERSMSELFDSLSTPVIAAVNGFAITGGFELALMCDFRIASTEARFADTHARLGVVPGWGLSQRLPHLIGAPRAKELSLTGNYLDAETAASWGVVNRVVGVAELMPTSIALASDIAGCAGPVQTEIKALIESSVNVSLADGLRHERSVADAHNGSVAGSDIETRRKSVLARGREQS
jgi:enoyl-CoA hydratase